MKINITKKYLVFPVNKASDNKLLSFYENDACVYSVNIRLDSDNPDFFSYIDVSRFIGKTLSVAVNPDVPVSFREADSIDIPDIYKESFRPRIHFTAKNGWLNDPNGLICLNGKYHMFFQYNPSEPGWNNMHWGHAVSTDLIHWDELDIAMFPNEDEMIFSGCAIKADSNASAENSESAILFYTTTAPFAQRMAYTNDGFKTISAAGKNPVIPNITKENRDPSVVYSDELNCYVMALYMGKGNYGLFKSEDMKSWTELQTLQIDGDRECPDAFFISDNNGKKNVVIMGANDKYIVGKFSDGKFVPSQEVRTLQHATGISRETAYAGQTFSNLPDGRIVRICWGQLPKWEHNFRGQMSFPLELKLEDINGTKYLSAKPIKEIETLFMNTDTVRNIKTSDTIRYSTALTANPYYIKLGGKLQSNTVITLTVFEKKIIIDFSENKISYGSYSAPLCVTGNALDIELIIDICSAEIYTDGGKAYLYVADMCNMNQPELTLESDNPYTLETLEASALKSIH